MPLVIPVFIPHRGCPHQCLFCNQEKIAGTGRNEQQKVDVAAIVAEWLKRSPDYDEVQVGFFGGSFTCLPVAEQVSLLLAVQPFIERQQVDCIRISTRPDCIDPGVCELLQNYHVEIVELGVQSLTDKVLQLAQRGHTANQCRDAFLLLKESDMQVGLQLMPGLPGETSRTFLAGVREVVAMEPDFVRLYPVVVVKESGLEKLYGENRYQPLSLNKAIALTARSYEKLVGAGIRVVRMGLQPSETLTQNVVAGPYHPAFGELVMSRIWLKKIRTQLALLQPGEEMTIHISNRDQSAVHGKGRRNIKRLEELGLGGRFTIVPQKTMARGNIEYVVS